MHKYSIKKNTGYTQFKNSSCFLHRLYGAILQCKNRWNATLVWKPEHPWVFLSLWIIIATFPLMFIYFWLHTTSCSYPLSLGFISLALSLLGEANSSMKSKKLCSYLLFTKSAFSSEILFKVLAKLMLTDGKNIYCGSSFSLGSEPIDLTPQVPNPCLEDPQGLPDAIGKQFRSCSEVLCGNLSICGFGINRESRNRSPWILMSNCIRKK